MYQMESRGDVNVKGKGKMETFWLINRLTETKWTERADEKKMGISSTVSRIEDEGRRP